MLILRMRIQERHITENSKRYVPAPFMPHTGLRLREPKIIYILLKAIETHLMLKKSYQITRFKLGYYAI